MLNSPSHRRIAGLLAIAVALAGCVSGPARSAVTANYLSGRFAAGQNAVGEAATAFGSAAQASPGQASVARDALFYNLASGSIEAAAPFARSLSAAEGAPDGLSQITLAAIAIKKGRLLEARAELARDFRDPLLNSMSHLAEVWIESGIAGPVSALAMLGTGGDDLFKGFDATHRALLAEMAGDIEAARVAHQLSVFSFGGPVGRAAYGAFLERAGDVDAARDYYTLLLSEPGPTRRLAEAGLERLTKKRRNSAYRSVKPNEGVAIALYSFAGAVLEQTIGQRQRAADAGFRVSDPRYNLPLALAQLAIYLDPDLVEARRLASSIFNVYGDYPRAAEILSAIPAKSPHFEQAQIEIAAGLARAGDVAGAERVLNRAIRADATSLEARLTLAGVLANDERHGEAAEAATSAIERIGDEAPDDTWRYFIARAASLLELGQWPKAEADLKRAVEIAPEEPIALNYLGYSWAERGENLDEAFALIEKAVALEPSSGAIIDSLGWAHYQRGEYQKAIPHLERAATLEPGDPTITDHLGDAYWRVGRTLEAGYEWRRALELDPSEKVRTVLLRKIERGLDAKANAP